MATVANLHAHHSVHHLHHHFATYIGKRDRIETAMGTAIQAQHISFMDTRLSMMAEARVSFMDTTPDAFSQEVSIPVIVDPEGDLFLVTKSRHFQVSSKVLSLASPVWAIILRNQLQQAAPGPAFLRLELAYDETVEAFEIIMNIVHFRRKELIPTFLSPHALFQVAIFCHRYDMSAALRSWAYRWIRHIQWKDKASDAVRWLAVAWTFRDETTFKNITRFLIRHGKLIKDPNDPFATPFLADPNHNRLGGEGIPPVIVELLNNAVKELHDKMAQLVQQVVVAYFTAEIPICKRQGGPACDRLQMTAVMHHLKKIGMVSVLQPVFTLTEQQQYNQQQVYMNSYGRQFNISLPSPTTPSDGLDSRRRSAEVVIQTFKGVTENFSRELEGHHEHCSPFPEMWERLSKLESQGFDLWEVEALVERRAMEEQAQAQADQERLMAAERERADRIALEQALAGELESRSEPYYMSRPVTPAVLQN